MEETGDRQTVPPPVSTYVQPRLSVWKKLKGFGLKKLFLICMGIGAGLGIGIVATVASVVWLTSRPMPPREWPRLEVQGVGLTAKLKTDWNDSLRYQLVVTPRSDDLKAAFDDTVRLHRDSISFTVHLYDKAGFELCKKDVKPTPYVDTENRIDGLHANDSFYSFECSRSSYKEADHWSLSYVFPSMTPDMSSGATATNDLKWYKKVGPDGTWYKTQASSEQEARSKLAKMIADSTRQHPNDAKAKPASLGENESNDHEDTLTGFDSFSGHLETLSGSTFLVREGERDIASMWNIRVQVEGGKQPRLYIACKAQGDCVIENTTNQQAVHGKKLQ